MILNEEKVIQVIADFLSDYINSTPLKNFWIRYHIKPNDDLLIKACEKAREKCGADTYLRSMPDRMHNVFLKGGFSSTSECKQYDFAKDEFPKDIDLCLVVSPLCRNDGLIRRSFEKHKPSDVYPLLDLYSSEVCQILGSEFIDDGLEFIDRENTKNGIITSDVSPLKHKDWFKYTKSQKVLIAEMHAREKATRHKDLLSSGALYPRIRHTEYVR